MPPLGKVQRRDNDELWVPKPPDGGWGWIIVLASFGVNFIWGGLFNTYGILYKEFLVYFQQSRGYTSLIGSVLNGVGYGAGIVASALMNRYGIRAVAIVGGAVGGIACALCIFANSVLALILLFGGGVGMGHALSYTAAYIIVPYYFEKRRGMATGIAIAGSGIGNMVCAPLMRYLIKEYTWRIFVVIEGGIILQCCIFGALFRAVPFVRLERKEETAPEMEPMLSKVEEETEFQKGREIQTGTSARDEQRKLPIQTPATEQHRQKRRDIQYPTIEEDGQERREIQIPSNEEPGEKRREIQNQTETTPIRANGTPGYRNIGNRSRKYSDNTEYSQARHSSVLPSIPETTTQDKALRPRLYSHQLDNADRTFSLDGTRLAPPRRYTHAGSKPFIRKDIYYAHSLRQLDEYKSNPDLFWQSALSIPVTAGHQAPTEPAVPEKINQEIQSENFLCRWPWCRRLSKIMGLHLLARPEFCLLAGAIFALYFGYYVPYTVLYDFALERGVKADYAVMLLMIKGAANTVGRVVLGSVADLQCVNRVVFFAAIMFLMGTSCCLCVFYTNFYLMAAYAAVFAGCVGASKAMTLIVTVDLLGLENLTNAYGLLLLFQGIGFILGNPFAGWMHDLTKSYVIPFSVIGALLILSGFLILLASRIKRKGSK